MIRFNDDGTAEVDYQRKTIHLTEPTLSQQAELYDMLYEAQKVLAANSKQAKTVQDQRVFDDDGNDITDEETLHKIWEESTAMGRKSQQAVARVVAHAVKVLGDDEETAKKFAADPPVWASNIQGFIRLIDHFNAVPFDGPGNPDV